MNAKLKFEKIYTLSNLLSFVRLLFSIPVAYLVYNIDGSYSTRIIIVLVLLVATLTDYLDGYFARKNNEISELGKIIDPLADKVLIGVTIVMLYIAGELTDFYLAIVLGRDILIFVGGIFVSLKVGRVIPSDMIGKITVAFIGLFLLAIILKLSLYASLVFQVLYYANVILIFASFLNYSFRAFKIIRTNSE